MYFTNKRKAIIIEAQIFTKTKRIAARVEILIVSCGVPKQIDSLVPRAVSLISTDDCPKKAHNSLRVIYEKPNKTKESFAVCHKALRFSVSDMRLKIIEWLELLRILGVSKVIFYSLGFNQDLERVLKYYKKTVSQEFTTINESFNK